MKQDEIDRCLVLVYQSRNNAMHVNYSVPCERVDRLCLTPEAKDELIRTLRRLADDIQRKYPSRDTLIRELASAKRRERVWRDSNYQCHAGFGGEEYAANVDSETMNSMDRDGNDNRPTGQTALDSGVCEWIEKVTDRAGTTDADALILNAAGELLNDLNIRLCHARGLLLACKCPSVR